MSGNLLFEAVLILVLIVVNGFFAASEIAIVSARKGRLEQQAEEGHHGSRVALELAQNPNRFLSTVQVGITIISTLAAAFGGANFAEALEPPLAQIPALAPYAEPLALVFVVLMISYLSLIVGELVPKRLALQSAEATAGVVAPAMRWMARVAGPVVSFLTFSTELVLRLLGRHNVAEQAVTEDDVRALVREGTAEGSLEQAEEELINSVFTFTERTVRSLMTPRTQVVALDIDTPFDQALQFVTESGYSRIPVYQDSLDQVIGILYVKDLLRAWGQPSSATMRGLLRPPLHVLESQRAVAAFQILKQQRSALAIVLDEYGQVSGLVSIEDMLEELVGDIDDEYDEQEEAIVKREDGSYLVDGLLPFVDLCERLDLPDAEEIRREHDFETVAGFVLALLGRIPAVGDTVTWQRYRLEVVDMDARRIDKILLCPPIPPHDQNQNVLASGAARTVTPQK